MVNDEMSELDNKITEVFPGVTVRKDLVSAVKGNALVPSYVLEYLLSKYATNTDQASIDAGVDRVRTILSENYVHREEANLVQSKIREKGRYQVIDKVKVELNDKLDQYEASFENLGIEKVVVDPSTVKSNPKLLVTGIWCMSTIVYAFSGEAGDVPWRLQRLQPVQMSRDDRENYIEMRPRFTSEEWIDLLMQSVGFNPKLFGERAKLLHLVRMIPFVERNYNLIELGPKGTGKSHIYSEFSPHGMLISGGEVTAAKLFVNNSNRQIGLVGFWDTVAFDEFAGRAKKADNALVDIMKNYMANKSFSRGTSVMQAEASMVFVGNTSHNVPYMLKNSDLFEELPKQYHDPAFLDRVHFYVPGWEFEQIRSEMFTGGFGFVVDYLAEILHNLRDVDYGSLYEKYFTLSPTLSTRDKDGIKKTFSGLMKLVYPTGDASADEMELLLRCAIEGRKRVKDQLCRIDSTMAAVDFSYTRIGKESPETVETIEEKDYPELYRQNANDELANQERGTKESDKQEEINLSSLLKPVVSLDVPATSQRPEQSVPSALSPIERAAAAAKAGHREFKEDQRGITYSGLLAPYIAGATEITLKDPYIRTSHQIRNLVEFLETVFNYTERTDEVHVRLITGQADDDYVSGQIRNLDEVQASFTELGIQFSYTFDDNGHDRSVVSNTGWRAILGRGLDVYQPFNATNWLNPLVRQQKLRRVKAFEVTYVKEVQD
jgi:ATP-dependent Lon protease